MKPKARQNIQEANGVLTAYLESTSDDEGVMDDLLFERFNDNDALMNLVFGLVGVGGELLDRLSAATGQTPNEILHEIGIKYAG